MAIKYDSSVNVLGSIPDYSSMMDFICEYGGRMPDGQGSFSFQEKLMVLFGNIK